MPVLLEHIHQPTEADWNDIEKIHQETLTNGLTFDRAQLEQWLASGGWIMAGRFNDRLIGLMLAKGNAGYVELSQAAVRKLTQRRGVMHQLMHHILVWSEEQQRPLVLSQCTAILNNALQKRGFVQQGNSWHYDSASKTR